MSKSYKTLQSIQKHLNDGQYQAFSKKLSSFKTQRQIFDELRKSLKEKGLAENYAIQLYKQMSHAQAEGGKDIKALKQIKGAIDNQKQFEEFKKKMNELSLEELKNELSNYMGKKKAQTIAGELFQQLLRLREENCKALLQLKGQLKQQQFLAFKQKIKKMATVDEILQELSNYMGKKKARAIAEKLFKELGLNQSKKDKILIEIQKQIGSKDDYIQFTGQIPNFTKVQDIVSQLQNYIKKQKAQALGEELFCELNKDKKIQPKSSSNPVKPSVAQKSPPPKAADNAIGKAEKLIGDKTAIYNFKKRMGDIEFIEDLIEQLTNYTNKKEATKLAEQIFKETGKDRKIHQKIEYMYKSLALKGIDEMSIQNIRKLVQQGKQNAVKRNLCYVLGPVIGNKIFTQFESDIEERPSEPLPGCKFITQKNGLKIHQYKETIFDFQKTGAKTLIVFGETGCGKTTFLNSIVNYIAGVQMEDGFRYKIIIENEQSQKNSITSNITSYFIKSRRDHTVYRLIDTPGFGDTGGVEKDNKIVEMVKHKFKSEIDSVHNILFLLKSSTTRVTHYQRYVFQSIMDLFNKNIAPNFVFIFTFSDSGKPQVLESVKDNTYGFGDYWHLIQEPKYLQVNNCGIFQKINLEDKIKVGYWQIGMMCMQNLFNKIHKIKPESLTLSRQLLDNRQALTNKMRIVRQKIQNAVAKRQNFINELQQTMKYQKQIDSNKNFEYEVDVQQYYTQVTSDNVTRCINCYEINCHYKCRYGDNQDKRQCVAFDKITGNCTICTGKCHFTVHKNEHFLRKVRTVKQKKQNSVNKTIFLQSSSKLKTSEQIINSLMDQIFKVVKTAIDCTKQMTQIQKELHAQQMSSKKPQSTVQYLQHLIANEERDRKPGYINRVKGMNEMIKEYEFYEKSSKNGAIQDHILKEFQYKTILERIQQTNNPSFITTFKNFFTKFFN